MKVCTKCGEEKHLGEYFKNAKGKDGLYPSCKACVAAWHKQYKINNPEKVSQTQKISWHKNKDKNREKHIRKVTKWAKENPDKLNASAIRRYKKNSDELTDSYIRQLLIGSGWSNDIIKAIPILIEIKKQTVKANRYVKTENQKGNKHE